MTTAKKTAAKPLKPKSGKPKAPGAKSPRGSEPPYAVETFAPREAIGYLVTRTRTALWEELDRILAPLDVTVSQWVIIASLMKAEMITPAEICKAISYDPGAMTRLLDRLEKKAFIRRVRHVADRRSVTLELTSAGRDLYPKIVRLMVAAYNQVLTGFSAAEVRQLEGLLQRLLVNLGAGPPAAASPLSGLKEKTP